MSQSKVTSFYSARKTKSRLNIKSSNLLRETEEAKDVSLSSLKSNIGTRKNIKKQNINSEYSDPTAVLNACVKNESLLCNDNTIDNSQRVHETVKEKTVQFCKKDNKIEKFVIKEEVGELFKKPTVQAERKVKKKENKTKNNVDLSQSKVTSFYGFPGTQKNTKEQNINSEYSDPTAVLNACVKNKSLLCNDNTTIDNSQRVDETLKEKSDQFCKKDNKIKKSETKKEVRELFKKPTVQAEHKVKKKENKTKNNIDLSQSKVSSFYGTRNSIKKIIDETDTKEISDEAPTFNEKKDIATVLDVRKENKKSKKDPKIDKKSLVDASSSIDVGLPPQSMGNEITAQPTGEVKQLKCDKVFAKSKHLQASKYSPIKSPSKNPSAVENTRLLSLKLKSMGMIQDINNIKTDLKSNMVVSTENLMRSPKRHLINPNEGTPPKKKLPLAVEHGSLQSPSKLSKISPKKLFVEENTSDAEKFQSCKKNKIISQDLSEEAQNIAIFKKNLALVKNNEANKFKVTSVVSSTLENESQPTLPKVPFYQIYSNLVDSDISTSLILPYKYKLLLEMFRNMDSVVSILNNRKEKITFDKVKEGVQNIMKRNFSQNHLGQIVTIMPSAYNITVEKCNYKKAYELDYQLVITPILKTEKGNVKKAKNVTMTPQDLLNRKNVFNNELLNRVIHHHQEFLNGLKFPPIPVEKLRRWHPHFKVDSVPDIEVAALPEIPEAKVYSANDVLKQFIKGSLNGKNKLVKALKSVAEESTSTSAIELKPIKNEDPKKSTSNSALIGVCSDLLAKVRSRETAKLLKCMTEKPEETKRKAMLELLPKIVQILWHYFITEKKAAVPVDMAIEKITHSLSSLSTHEEVKAHLKLITEVYPDWLYFIEIKKGQYIRINKTKNITEMLKNSGCS